MTRRPASSPNPIIFAAVLGCASLVGLLIVVSPYIFTFHDPSAIHIGASLSPSQVGQNQTVKVTVSAVNTLRFPDELPVPGSLRTQNLSSGPCGGLYPLGIAVFQGKYGLDNFSSAKAIDVFDDYGFFGCPGEVITTGFTFEPQQNVTRLVELEGYWTAGETPHPGGGFSEGVLHPFLPGEYTLVAGDEWDHLTILHFTVT